MNGSFFNLNYKFICKTNNSYNKFVKRDKIEII